MSAAQILPDSIRNLPPQAKIALVDRLRSIPDGGAWKELARLQGAAAEVEYELREPHEKQRLFIESTAKRKVIRAGRRGGKTSGVALLAAKAFLAGRRVLYATPTQDQIERFWFETKRTFGKAIDRGALVKNETKHVVERTTSENRIRAKTAWNADTLRGDYADLLILDEYQLMSEDAWAVVGAPMLLDNNGDAVFVYTPPSIHSRSVTKARDPLHAAKLFKQAQIDSTGIWETFHFSSHDNPHLSREALEQITRDMTRLAYQQEIEAIDREDAPGALWNRELLEKCRVVAAPDLIRIVVAIDPSATSTGDEAGIIAAGIGSCSCKGPVETHGFVIEDSSLQGSPRAWAQSAVVTYHKLKADKMLAEQNNGGEMVRVTISTVDGAPPVELIHASRGKLTRAEPVAALYERGAVHHVGAFEELEDEYCQWMPGRPSPNRLDAAVFALTDLMLNKTQTTLGVPVSISKSSRWM